MSRRGFPRVWALLENLAERESETVFRETTETTTDNLYSRVPRLSGDGGEGPSQRRPKTIGSVHAARDDRSPWSWSPSSSRFLSGTPTGLISPNRCFLSAWKSKTRPPGHADTGSPMPSSVPPRSDVRHHGGGTCTARAGSTRRRALGTVSRRSNGFYG